MAEPAYNLQKDDGDQESSIRPNLQALEGGGESSEPRRGHLRSVGGDDASSESGSDSSESAAEKPSLYSGNEKSVGGAALGAMESGTAAGVASAIGGSMYSGSESGGFRRAKFLERFNFTKRKGIIAGSMVSVVLGGGIFFGTVSLGPLEIMELGHTLAHSLDRGNTESSSRVSQLFRWSRFKATGDIGETRVGRVGSKIFGSAVAELQDAGIKFVDRDPLTGRPGGITVDQDKLAKKYPGLDKMKPADAKAFLAEKLGITQDGISQLDLNVKHVGYRQFKVDLKGASIKSVRLVTQSSLSTLGDGGLESGMKMRVFAKFFNIPPAFHPFDKARAAAEQKASDRISAEKQKRGEAKAKADAEAKVAAQAEVEAQSVSTITDPIVAEGQPAISEVRSTAGSVLGKVGAGLAIGGLACLAYNEAGNIAKINQALVAEPAAALALRIMSGGQQAQRNTDLRLSDLGALHKSLVDANGQTVWKSTGINALRNPNAPATGVELPVEYRQAYSGQSTAKNIQQGAADMFGSVTNAGAACGQAGMTIQIVGAILATVGGEVLSGGLATPGVAALWTTKFVATTLVTGVATVAVIHLIETILVNDKLDTKILSGPIGGGLLAYGSRALGNISSVSSGGIDLGNQTSTLSSIINNPDGSVAYDYQDPTSLGNRLFGTGSDSSLTMQFASTLYGSDWSSKLSGFASSITNVGGVFSSLFSSLMPHAAAANGYNWGFSQYGIPDDMLLDPALANPYANADQVAAALDSSSGQNYIDKANACFGVSIAKVSDGSQQVWEVKPDHQVDTSSLDYSNADCTERGTGGNVDGSMWRRTIMFVFDSRTMDAAACFQGDDDACTRATGQDASNSGSTTGSGSTGPVDQATMYQDSTDIACAPGTTDIGLHAGYHDYKQITVRLCAIPGLTSSGEESNGGFNSGYNGGMAIVNSRVSANFLALEKAATADGRTLTAKSSFRTMANQQSLCPCDGKNVAIPGTSNHQMGLAIDFSGITGLQGSCSANRATDPTNKDWQWLNTNAAKFGIKQYGHEAWHWDPLIDPSRCGGDGT